MRSDADIKTDVEAELGRDPDLDATDIAVSVSKGVVTLAGFVKSYPHKFEAEKAAKRVAGVVGVADDLEVHLPTSDEKTDPEIAREAVAAIKDRLSAAAERIKPIVKNGWVTLEGEVEWNYQRQGAEEEVYAIMGVHGVTNSIKLKPRMHPEDIKRKIEEDLRRNAELDASRIEVETNGGEVILKGRVRSWAEREEAERAAWAAPGVVKVEDRIVVGP